MTSAGTKLFGAAIFHKPTLSLVLADTNHESASPLNHGETYAIMKFFEIPADKRPDPKDCIFFATHEPCSLCINAIVWSGFDNFVFMWSYEETDGLFGISGDLDIWHDCFYDEVAGADTGAEADRTGSGLARTPALYKAVNPRFVARSVDDLVRATGDEKQWTEKVNQVKMDYGKLSPFFRKKMGI